MSGGQLSPVTATTTAQPPAPPSPASPTTRNRPTPGDDRPRRRRRRRRRRARRARGDDVPARYAAGDATAQTGLGTGGGVDPAHQACEFPEGRRGHAQPGPRVHRRTAGSPRPGRPTVLGDDPRLKRKNAALPEADRPLPDRPCRHVVKVPVGRSANPSRSRTIGEVDEPAVSDAADRDNPRCSRTPPVHCAIGGLSRSVGCLSRALTRTRRDGVLRGPPNRSAALMGPALCLWSAPDGSGRHVRSSW